MLKVEFVKVESKYACPEDTEFGKIKLTHHETDDPDGDKHN